MFARHVQTTATAQPFSRSGFTLRTWCQHLLAPWVIYDKLTFGTLPLLETVPVFIQPADVEDCAHTLEQQLGIAGPLTAPLDQFLVAEHAVKRINGSALNALRLQAHLQLHCDERSTAQAAITALEHLREADPNAEARSIARDSSDLAVCLAHLSHASKRNWQDLVTIYAPALAHSTLHQLGRFLLATAAASQPVALLIGNFRRNIHPCLNNNLPTANHIFLALRGIEAHSCQHMHAVSQICNRLPHIRSHQPSDLVQIAASLARCRYRDPAALRWLSAALAPSCTTLPPAQLIVMLSAFAELGFKDEAFLQCAYLALAPPTKPHQANSLAHIPPTQPPSQPCNRPTPPPGRDSIVTSPTLPLPSQQAPQQSSSPAQSPSQPSPGSPLPPAPLPSSSAPPLQLSVKRSSLPITSLGALAFSCAVFECDSDPLLQRILDGTHTLLQPKRARPLPPAQPGAPAPPGASQISRFMHPAVFKMYLWLLDSGQLDRLRVSERVHEAARKRMNSVHHTVTVSHAQHRYFSYLRSMGFNPIMEYRTADGLFSMDMVILYKGHRIAVEVDGPSHFSANIPYFPTGHTLLRNRFLAHRGYLPLSIPLYEFSRVKAPSARRSYVQDQLELAVASFNS